MMSSNFFSGYALAGVAHMIFGLTLFLGIVFLIIWAVRVLDKKKIGTWTAWLLGLGIIGVLLTCSWGYQGYRGMGYNSFGVGGGYGMMGGGMMNAMWDDLDAGTQQKWLEYMKEGMKEQMEEGVSF